MYKFTSVPAFSMRPKPKPEPENKNPGPGNYDLDPNALNKISTHTRYAKYGFSKDRRLKDDVNINPGPGRYDSPNRQRSKGGYMGAKSRDKEPSNVPGPGAYEDKSKFFNGPKSPMYSMLKKYETSFLKNVPGKIFPFKYVLQAQDNMIIIMIIFYQECTQVKLFQKHQN